MTLIQGTQVATTRTGTSTVVAVVTQQAPSTAMKRGSVRVSKKLARSETYQVQGGNIFTPLRNKKSKINNTGHCKCRGTDFMFEMEHKFRKVALGRINKKTEDK